MKKPIKLLMGVPHPNTIGGPPTHLPFLVEYFRRRDDYEIETFFIGSRANGTAKGERETIFLKVLATMRDVILFTFKVLRRRPDIVHINSAFALFTVIRDTPYAYIAKVFGCKTFLKIHGSHEDFLFTESRFKRGLVRMLFKKIDRVGVLSTIERDQFAEKFGNTHKLVVCKNIVLKKRKDLPFSELKVEPGKIYGLFVSRIDHKKGLIDLINSVPLIIKEKPNFVLLIAGDGEALATCKNRVHELNVEQYVQWLGFVDSSQILDVYRQSDVFIFPTIYPEGMPMALIDALRMGIPIVTTKVRFAKSYLEEGVNCLYSERNNSSDLSQKILQLLEDEKMKLRMRNENPNLIRHFEPGVVGEEFHDFYTDSI